MDWRLGLVRFLTTLSLAWCMAVGWWIWATPVRYSGISNGVPALRNRTFAEVSLLGPVPLIVPAALAALAVWAAWRRRRLLVGFAALLLATFAFIAGFSIGGAYIPAAGLLVAAAGLAFAIGTRPHGIGGHLTGPAADERSDVQQLGA